MELYSKMASRPIEVDLAQLWRQLGVRLNGGEMYWTIRRHGQPFELTSAYEQKEEVRSMKQMKIQLRQVSERHNPSR